MKQLFCTLAFALIMLTASAKENRDSLLADASLFQADTLLQDTEADINSLPVDTIAWDKNKADSAAFAAMPWYQQLFKNGFRIHDPRVNYPKFPRFCLKVYDWGDRTFNSYDPEYVVGVGKNWKVLMKNYNWMESYMLMFSMHSRDMLHIRSNIFNDLGAYISFMAVSVGYTANVNALAGHESNRSNLNFNFTCSRFTANIDILSTTGNTRITHFGKYNPGYNLNYRLDDIEHKALSGEFFYFFNHRKYSHAAAYCFSKYQLKGAGTAIIGLAFNNQRISINFSSLPEEMKQALPDLENLYRFRYTDYAIVSGYAHNWVLHPRRWLINLTTNPSIGFRHSYADSSEGSKTMLATNLRARFAFVYNHKALFASLSGRVDANLFFNSKYAFFNSTESVSLIVGARF